MSNAPRDKISRAGLPHSDNAIDDEHRHIQANNANGDAAYPAQVVDPSLEAERQDIEPPLGDRSEGS